MAVSVVPSAVNVRGSFQGPVLKTRLGSLSSSSCSIRGPPSSSPQPRAPRRLTCVAASGGLSSKDRLEQWEKARSVLVKQVKSVTPAEAARLVQAGKCRILDVRTVQEFADVHPEGAINAQFYRLIKEWTPRDVLRRAGFAFFGVFNGTEENPEFLADVAQVAKKGDALVLACMMGGTLKPSTNFPAGKESRSLNAAYALCSNGYTNISHMEGGLAAYFREDLPVVFKD